MKKIYEFVAVILYLCLINCEGTINRNNVEENNQDTLSQGMNTDQYRKLINKYLKPVADYRSDSIPEISDTVDYSFHHNNLLFTGSFITNNVWTPIEVYNQSGQKVVTIEVALIGKYIKPRQFLYWNDKGEPISDSSFYQSMKYLDSNTLKFKYEPISRTSDCYLIVSSFSLYNYEPHGGDSLVIDLKASNYDVEIPLTPNLLRKGGYFTGVIIERRPKTGTVKKIGVFNHPKFNDVGNNNKTK